MYGYLDENSATFAVGTGKMIALTYI
jgi:hypothetical protein